MFFLNERKKITVLKQKDIDKQCSIVCFFLGRKQSIYSVEMINCSDEFEEISENSRHKKVI